MNSGEHSASRHADVLREESPELLAPDRTEEMRRLLSAVAYGIRRQQWGDALLDHAFGIAIHPTDEEALAIVQAIADAAGLAGFDASTAR